jgi:hypothetical protein
VSAEFKAESFLQSNFDAVGGGLDFFGGEGALGAAEGERNGEGFFVGGDFFCRRGR